MGEYKINGQEISTVIQTVKSTDRRFKAGFNELNFLYNGQTRTSAYSDSKFSTSAEGFHYASTIQPNYTKMGTKYTLAKKGYRPSSYYKYSTKATSNMYINKFSDGELWVSSSNDSRTGTRIGTAEENINAMFACYCGGGGGGGGGSGSAAAGGGGGGGYRYISFKIEPYYDYAFKAGNAGAAGTSNSSGSAGGYSYFIIANGTAPISWNAWGGSGGQGGSAGAGGGAGGGTGYGQSPPNRFVWGSYVYEIKSITGSSGAKGGASASSCLCNFNNYTPEAEQITYMTGGGGDVGSSGGGGGGGTSPLGFGGDGGGPYEDGKAGDNSGAGGGGGTFVWFSSTKGGSGTAGYFSLWY